MVDFLYTYITMHPDLHVQYLIAKQYLSDTMIRIIQNDYLL